MPSKLRYLETRDLTCWIPRPDYLTALRLLLSKFSGGWKPCKGEPVNFARYFIAELGRATMPADFGRHGFRRAQSSRGRSYVSA